MCEELERLKHEVEFKQRRVERETAMLNGAQPDPNMEGFSREQRHQNEIRAKIDEAAEELRLAPERVKRHQAEHGCA